MSGHITPPSSATLPPPGQVSAIRRRPRWGVQTGLWQPFQPAFWLYVVALFLGLLYALVVQILAAATSPAGWALSWVLLLLYILPVVLVVRWLDLYEREPRSMMFAAFLWGALVATFFAGFANDLWGIVIARLTGAEFAGEWSAALTAPFTEETYKYLGLVVLWLIARMEFDDTMDGFVYGALIGLGFAVIEDIFYFMFVFGGDIASVIEGFFVRVIASGLYGHVTFTGITGIGFAYFVTHRMDKSLANRFAVAAGLFLLGVAAHFVWNSPLLYNLPILLYGVVKGLPFLIGLALLLYLARRRENQDLELILTDEVGRPGLLPAEMAALTNRRSRRAAAKRVKQAAGGAAEQVLKQLQREQIRLALLASAADSPDDVQLLQQRIVVAGLRGKLWQFPGAAAAMGVDEATAAAPPVPAQWAAPFLADRTVASAGGWAWATPDQNDKRRIPLAPSLPLQIMDNRGGWILVRAQSGWAGWTGTPYLVAVPGAGGPAA